MKFKAAGMMISLAGFLLITWGGPGPIYLGCVLLINSWGWRQLEREEA